MLEHAVHAFDEKIQEVVGNVDNMVALNGTEVHSA